MLKGIQTFIDKLEIPTTNYPRSRDYFILASNEDMIKELDDNLVMISNILASRYVHGIKQKVEQTGKQLKYFQELLDEWGICQRAWMYLEPIFGGNDLMKDLAKESSRFNKDVH